MNAIILYMALVKIWQKEVQEILGGTFGADIGKVYRHIIFKIKIEFTTPRGCKINIA